MILWLRAHQAGWVVVGALVASLGLGTLGSPTIPVPAVAERAAPLPLLLFLAMAPVIALARGLDSAQLERDATASRPQEAIRLVFVCSAAAAAAGLCALLGRFAEANLGGAVARNILGLTGMFLAGRAVVGSQAGIAVPTLYLVVAAVLGRRAGDAVAPWAWAMNATAAWWSFTWALAWLAGGAALHMGSRRHLRIER